MNFEILHLKIFIFLMIHNFNLAFTQIWHNLNFDSHTIVAATMSHFCATAFLPSASLVGLKSASFAKAWELLIALQKLLIAFLGLSLGYFPKKTAG